MGKRKRPIALIETDSDNDSHHNTDIDELMQIKNVQELKLLTKTKRSGFTEGPKTKTLCDNSETNWNSRSGRVVSGRNKNSKLRKVKVVSDSDSERDDTEALEDGEVWESDSEENTDNDEFDDGLDENLLGDAEDKKRLEQMTEKEREQEIFNRLEKREILKTRFSIEKKLREVKRRQREKEKKQLMVLASAETLATSRSLDRRMAVDSRAFSNKTFSALQNLKAKREQKQESVLKQRAKDVKKQPSRLRADEIYSDENSDDEIDKAPSVSSDPEQPGSDSDFEGGRKPSSHSSSSNSPSSDSEDGKTSKEADEETNKKLQVITTKEELSKIRLSRFRLEKWIFMPFFKNVVLGCFVRIGIGSNQGKPVYRVAEIVDVVETAKIYQLDSGRTNKGLKLKHGIAERVYRLEFVSNQPFTDHEFAKWREAMVLGEQSLPSLFQVEKKVSALKQVSSYSYKESDIDEILSEKWRFRKNPYNYAMRKTLLMKQKEMAECEGDHQKSEEIKQQLDELEERAKELDNQRTSTISCIRSINERNRRLDLENGEEASKREATERRLAIADPFTRRPCKPTLVTKSHDPEINRLIKERIHHKYMPEAELLRIAKLAESADTAAVLSHGAEADCCETRLVTGDASQTDLCSVHDFDVNIDLSVSAVGRVSSNSSSTDALETPSSGSRRRHLNLDEYKRKRGLY